MTRTRTIGLPFILITALFFLWGFAHNLNPILIPHLKKACQLTDFQSSLIDSSFFIGYFAMALPAGFLLNRYGYKRGIVLGLLIFALGAFLFYPAAQVREFGFFLGALFIIASGLTLLETAANPYITVLGDPATATQRINLAQSFNGLAATLAPLLGGKFILSGMSLTEGELNAMAPAELDAYLNHEASSVQIPYLVIGLVVLAVAWLVSRVHLPDMAEEAQEASPEKTSIFAQKQLVRGVVAQFFYVGAQVCISSFFIRFLEKTAGIDEKTAAIYLSIALLAFMIGRFTGTFLMRYVSPRVLLAGYSVANFVLLVVAINTEGMVPVHALIAVEFFMSIMFPTIFSLSIQGLGPHTKLGSSLLIMSVVGGAFFPVLMGALSDRSSIQTAYSVPTACFLVILYFALRTKQTNEKVSMAHHA